jgi:hypothetical protein
VVLRRLADHRRPDSLAARWRQRRFARFLALVAPLARPVRILDVGGDEGFWRSMGYSPAWGFELTILNLAATPATLPHTRIVAGDARAMPEFEDRSFDVVFSNSVIEHLFTYEAQQAMAREVRRVGQRYWVQTPNRYFPIEPHFLFPFFQFLPRGARVWIASRWTAGWYSAPGDAVLAGRRVDEIRLLTTSQLRALFPLARIEREQVGPLAKSLIALEGL